METIDGRKYVNGIEIRTNHEGGVLWAADWVALFAMAKAKQHGLAIRNGGPDTFGHADVVVAQ